MAYMFRAWVLRRFMGEFNSGVGFKVEYRSAKLVGRKMGHAERRVLRRLDQWPRRRCDLFPCG